MAHGRLRSSFAAGNEPGAAMIHFEPRGFAERTNPKRKRAAAIGDQEQSRIVSGIYQLAAQR
jgi:hypothetical protein